VLFSFFLFILLLPVFLMKFSNPDFALDDATGLQLLSRINLDRLPNKSDSSNVSKDGKIEAVHGLLEQR